MKLTPVVLIVALAACEKTAEREQIEAVKAAAEADEARLQYLAAVERERGELIEKLDLAIRAIDRRVLELDPVLASREREELSYRRELLRAHLDAVQSSTEANWTSVKERVERDLAGGGRS